MSSGEVRRVSRQDIQLVQNLIERCLQLYMNQKEVVNTLLIQAKIEPGFTELVWQKLEEENREFFKAYHVRLMVKNQIMMFNQLLEKQAQLMHEINPTGGSPISLPNGSNQSSFHQMPLGYASVSRPDNTYCTALPSNIINGGRMSHEGMHMTNDLSMSLGRIDMSTSMLPNHSQSMTMGMMQGMNNTSMKLEPSYSNNSDFHFCTESNFLEERPAIGDGPGSSFNCAELNGQPLNDPILDTDQSSFGFLSQIPRNFSFSDLTDHFSQGTDILESYGKSPFLGTEGNNFAGSPGRECEGENKRLDTISEGATYDGFCSD